MVFFNYATMQMAAKIVYYGPGLCGKTTNLHQIYTKTAPQSRGEMVSLETETDRTLFFDLLPIDVGVIGGFKTRLQLYTVPGQVFYNTTRKLVLKGVDGIVFVADSQRAMVEANVESFKNLRENLSEIGLNLDELPVVVQLNKRDLPNIADADTILNALDPERRHEHVEAIAASGVGVFETLKVISKLTLRTLRRRMTGEEQAKPAAPRPAMQFRVKDDAAAAPNRTLSGNTPTPPVPAAAPAAAPPIAAAPPAPRVEPAPAPEPPPALFAPPPVIAPPPVFAPPPVAAPVAVAAPAESFAPPAAPEPSPAFEHFAEPEPAPVEVPAADPVADLFAVPPDFTDVDVSALPAEPDDLTFTNEDTLSLDETPSTQYIPPPSLAKAMTPPIASEPEVDFTQTDKPQKPAEVKTVKVRSSVDVMAELEALRKRSTQSGPTAPRSKRDSAERDSVAEALENLANPPRAKRDMQKNVAFPLDPSVLARARSVRVTVSFEDGDQGVIQSQEQFVELGDTTDVQSLSLNLKVDLG